MAFRVFVSCFHVLVTQFDSKVDGHDLGYHSDVIPYILICCSYAFPFTNYVFKTGTYRSAGKASV